VYAPYPSVPFSPLFVANSGSVGQYPQNTGPNFQEQFGMGGTFQGPVGGTFQDPVEGSAREQSFGGFNRAMGRGRKNPRPFFLHDTCVAMLNVGGQDTQIGVATPCQTDYVSMMTETDMTDVGARVAPMRSAGRLVQWADSTARRQVHLTSGQAPKDTCW